MNYNKLSKNPKIFKRLTGLLPEEFIQLKNSLEKEWQELVLQRKKQIFRKRMIGGGRKLSLPDLEDRILAFVFYAKFYPSQVLMECIFNVDESTICRTIQEMSILLSKKIIIDKNRKKITSLKELLETFPELKEVLVDATEQKVQRKDSKYNSGRKKQKTIKTQILTDKKGRILHVETYVPGSIHDFNLFKNSSLPDWLNRNKDRLILYADLGYQGIYKELPSVCSKIPLKRGSLRPTLNELEKEENKKLSQVRIEIEHTFSKLKKYWILSHSYRNSLDNYSNIFKSLAYLINFRMSLRES